jgi:GNAT superfamily N-acetyltransferase
MTEAGHGEFQIREALYESPDALALMEAIQAEYVVRYGGPDATPVDPVEFSPPDGWFVIGYLEGVPVAMGGLRRLSGDGPDTVEVEVKRMYVEPSARGNGYARLILGALEDRARSMGAIRVLLESGQKQPEAISLYTSSGYEPIEGFGHYRCAPLSLSFAKSLVGF